MTLETSGTIGVGEDLRVGIAGCGIRGSLFAAALAHQPGVRVVGMCDPATKTRRQIAQVFSGAVVPHHDELIGLGLDAFIVATPDFAHREVAVAAAGAGLQLMVEKPIATSTADAEEIQHAAVAAGVSCFVAFENRWNPYFRKLRRMVVAGELGDIVSVTGVLSNSYYVPSTMLSWASRSSPAWFLMPHLLDLATWLSGQTPRSVTARGRRGELVSRGIDTWDAVHALIDLGGSTIANLQTAWVLPDGRPSIVDFRLDVVGTRGAVSVDHGDQGLHVATADTYRSLTSLPEDVDGGEQSMAAWMVRAWARGLLAGDPVGPGAAYGVQITRAVEAVHQSAETGTIVHLDHT